MNTLIEKPKRQFRLIVPSRKDQKNRNWQAQCIFLLMTDHYGEDLRYVLKAPLTIVPFDNGRERGYTLKYKGLEVSFAEARSSDDIVVFPFAWDNPDEADKEKKYHELTKRFKYQDFYKAFSFILAFLGIEL